MRYCAAIAATLRVVAFDDLTLIYHRASGITHVLASPAPELLSALTEPLTLAELRARLVAEFELADAADGALQARLDELVAAGLVTAA